MTSEQFVKIKYPNARAERYVSGRIKGMQTTYYLIWTDFSSRGGGRIGEGKTIAKAWKDAKENIQ